MTDYISGMDVSKWQYRPNDPYNPIYIVEPYFDYIKSVSMGVRFNAVRATVGNYYTDIAFDAGDYCSFTASQEQFPTSAYHVFHPNNSVESQMARFFSALAYRNAYEDFPLILDCEIKGNSTKATRTQMIADCAEYVYSERGYYPLIYSNYDYMMNYCMDHDIWSKCELWIASYTTGAVPAMPAYWETFRIWQWSADGNGLGRDYGSPVGGSLSIDLNRFQGLDPNLTIEEEFALFTSLNTPLPPVPPLEPVYGIVNVEQPAAYSGVVARHMNPEGQPPKIGSFDHNARVEVVTDSAGVPIVVVSPTGYNYYKVYAYIGAGRLNIEEPANTPPD